MKSTKVFFYVFTIFLIFLTISLLCIFAFRGLNSSSPTPQTEPPSTEFLPDCPTVIIDAGHGGEDGGAIGVNGAYEKDINLMIALKLKVRLEALGIKTVLTRSTDTLLYDKNADFEGKKKKLDMQARKKIAESYENAIFVSIHQNSFVKEQYSGFQTYYSPNSPSSYELALTLENEARTAIAPSNVRASKKSDSSIYLLDKLYCPAILVECGFISNRKECSLLCSEQYQASLCDALASAIKKHIISS